MMYDSCLDNLNCRVQREKPNIVRVGNKKCKSAILNLSCAHTYTPPYNVAHPDPFFVQFFPFLVHQKRPKTRRTPTSEKCRTSNTFAFLFPCTETLQFRAENESGVQNIVRRRPFEKEKCSLRARHLSKDIVQCRRRVCWSRTYYY
jgi:hypothetical protein